MSNFSSNSSRGVSVVELVVYIGIAGLLIIGLSMLVGTGIRSNRFQFEQVLTTEDARRQLELISDTIRSARNEAENDWLVAAGDDTITIRTDFDTDGSIDQVRYFLDENDLRRGITKSGESEKVRTVARSIRNQLAGQTLFTYYTAEGSELPATQATSTTAHRVTLALVLSVSDQTPDAGEIITDIKPRSEDTETVRLWPVTLQLPGGIPTSYLDSDEGTVGVVVTNPDTGAQTSETITLADLNDGRVGTYTGDYYVNLNYQDQTVGADLPGWYAWVGPIAVGERDSTILQAVDKIVQTGLCLTADLGQLLTSCSNRSVTNEGFVQRYLPILTYTHLGGEVDYVRDIAFVLPATPTPSASPTPDPSASPTPTPSPDPCNHNGTCDPNETAAECPVDNCPSDPDCDNDNVCEPPEDDATCPLDNCDPSGGILPVIHLFTINGTEICQSSSICTVGGGVTRLLSWSVNFAQQCTPSWRPGTLSLNSGSESVVAEMNTTYTITCTNVNGSVQDTVMQTFDLSTIGCGCS